MTTRTVKIALLTVPAVGLLALVGATAASASKPQPDHKVTLCHRTGSVSGGNQHNGYSIITVDIASVANAKDVRGHDGHDQIGNGPGGDIIPIFTYGTFTYPGKNLDNGGAAFLANGCHAVQPSPSPSVTLTPTSSPTSSPTATPTMTPTATPTATVTATPTQTATATSSPTPPVIIVTPPPSPVQSPPAQSPPPPPIHHGTGTGLPMTGDNTSQEALYGLALLFAGYGFVRLGLA